MTTFFLALTIACLAALPVVMLLYPLLQSRD